jgi:hypothetical protein
MEDFEHEYYFVVRFKAAYKRLIESLPDRSQWPDVDLPFGVMAPLDKKTAGRYRKLRIKDFLEGGGRAAKERRQPRKQQTRQTKKLQMRQKRARKND